MLDLDLAGIYQVETRVLNQAVKRNIRRFPDDFMFQLTKEELENLKSQFVISSWGGTRKLPFAILKQHVEEAFTDYNDINEDTRMQLELINETLAGLQVKNKELKPRKPIGFTVPQYTQKTEDWI